MLPSRRRSGYVSRHLGLFLATDTRGSHSKWSKIGKWSAFHIPVGHFHLLPHRNIHAYTNLLRKSYYEWYLHGYFKVFNAYYLSTFIFLHSEFTWIHWYDAAVYWLSHVFIYWLVYLVRISSVCPDAVRNFCSGGWMTLLKSLAAQLYPIHPLFTLCVKVARIPFCIVCLSVCRVWLPSWFPKIAISPSNTKCNRNM